MKKLGITLEAIMLIIWIVTLIIFLSQIWTNGTKCMANPMSYGVNVLSKQNKDVGIECSCKFDNAPDYTLHVNLTESYLSQDELPGIGNKWFIPSINFTNIKGGD